MWRCPLCCLPRCTRCRPMALGPFLLHRLMWKCPLCCLPRCTRCRPRTGRLTQLHLPLREYHLEERPGRRRSGASRLSPSGLTPLVFELTLEVVMEFAPPRIHLRLDSCASLFFGMAGSLAVQVLQSGRTQECEVALNASGWPCGTKRRGVLRDEVDRPL